MMIKQFSCLALLTIVSLPISVHAADGPSIDDINAAAKASDKIWRARSFGENGCRDQTSMGTPTFTCEIVISNLAKPSPCSGGSGAVATAACMTYRSNCRTGNGPCDAPAGNPELLPAERTMKIMIRHFSKDSWELL